MPRRIQNFPKTKTLVFKSPSCITKVLLLLMILIELYHKGINHYTMSCLLFIHFTIYIYLAVSSRWFLVFSAASLCCGGQSWDWRPKMPPTHLGTSWQANGEMCLLPSSIQSNRHMNELNAFVSFVHRQENQHPCKCWGTFAPRDLSAWRRDSAG
jgi:hypothetical protein